MNAPLPGDKAAAFRGLLMTAVLLFVMAYAIVTWTNRQFAGHAKAASSANATH